MHICEFFLILFANTLTVCMSTDHSNIKPGTVISAMYSDQEIIQFDHLAVDKYGRWVYIGASDYLYQLSSNLELQVKFTLPELNSPDCTAQSCSNKLKKVHSRNPTRNKILLLDYQNQQLISCGSFFSDRCHAHSVSDISKLLVNRPESSVRGELYVSDVAFIAPNLLKNSTTPSSVAYVGDSVTGDTNDATEPTIAIKDLAHDNFFTDPRDNGVKLHLIRVLRKNSKYSRFICGFSLGNISYFLATGIFVNMNFVLNDQTYHGEGHLIRIDYQGKDYLHDDTFITCNDSETQSAWLKKRIKHGYIYEHAKGSDLESGTVEEKIMFLLFDVSLVSSTTATKGPDGFVVCKYNMNEIHLPDLKSTKMNGDLLFLHEGNTDVTAMAVTSMDNHILLFFGTNKGHLHKVSIKGFNSPEVDTVNYYPETIIDEGSPVNPDMLFDSTQNFLYVMTEKKLTKVKIHNCDQYNTSHTCLGARDPFCGWCFASSTCCLKTECTHQQNYTKWMSYDIYKHTNSSSNLGKKFPKTIDWNATNSVLKSLSHPFMNSTMICGTYKTCTLCVTSFLFYPCKWNVNQHKCTDETIWNSNDIVIGDNFDDVHSQKRNENFCNKFPRNDFYCPQFFTLDDNEPNIYIDVHERSRKTITVQYRIPAGLFNEKYEFEFEIEGNKTTHHTTIKEHYTFLNGYIEGEIKFSKLFEYTDQKPNTTVRLSVLWNGSKPLANPHNTSIVLYKCTNVGSHCNTCVEMKHCKWNLETRECEDDSVGTARNLDIKVKKQLCTDPTISFFKPEVGPWEGGTKISIYGNNLANTFYMFDNITVGDTPCSIWHTQSNDEAKAPLICVVNRCKSTFHNSSGPIKLFAKGLLLTSNTIFQFVDPKIHNIFPTTGSTSGGTELTIDGEHLDAGNIIEVHIGDLECVVFEYHSKQLKCLTGPSKLSFKTYVNIEFDGHIRISENVYEYDENLEPEENIRNVPRGVPTGRPGTSITLDLPIGINVIEEEEILFYIQDEERVNSVNTYLYFSKCEISNTSLVCPIPNINDRNRYFLDEKKPKRMAYGFKINSSNGINTGNFNITKKYPKYLLYPDSVGDLLQGKITKQQTTSIIAKWLLENIYLFIIGLVILVVITIHINHLLELEKICSKVKKNATTD